MSEITLATANPPDAPRVGTVGTVLPGVELRVAPDGELLVRTPAVMRGYRGDPGRTAETVDADGWLHTGDIGTVDADGYVSIVDRKKELIINSAGKNMSPSNIESAVKVAHPVVGSVVAIGDNRPYVTALVVLDPEVAAALAARPAIPAREAAGHPSVRAAVQTAVDQANAKLSRVEQVKRFHIVPDYWEPGSAELTPTMKLRRKPIAEKYAAEIDDLYS
ncbi:hypothetical protein ACFQV2_24950 [Actinokineospora soli]|uniref:Acyl-CoA synthetase n=1 Tax=Actinokineospora soli TaxID=1048753 RepID=A0ABW2TSC4_9PSEU